MKARTVTVKRVTGADVAIHAGVSRTLVSYVLNDTPGKSIPLATRVKVLNAAQELGYLPNSAARALKTGRGYIVLLVIPQGPHGPHVYETTEALAISLAARGYSLVVMTDREQIDIPLLLDSLAPAATIVLAEIRQHNYDALSQRAAAFLDFREWMAAPELQDRSLEAGRLQVEYLASLGHRKLAIVTTTHPQLQRYAMPRTQEAQDAADRLGVELTVLRALEPGSETIGQALTTFRDRGITGVCAYNDMFALGVLSHAYRLGIRVPDDLSLLGVADIPEAGLACPPLTTFRTDNSAIALRILRMVLPLLQEPDDVVLSSEPLMHIIERNSARYLL